MLIFFLYVIDKFVNGSLTLKEREKEEDANKKNNIKKSYSRSIAL